MSYSLESVTNNYELLSHINPQTREKANLFLMGLIYQDSAWKITQEMITTCANQNYQFLGAQILHQKIQKEILSLHKPQLQFLKTFLFSQLTTTSLNLATVRKITSSAALIAVVCCLEDWPNMLNDIVQFMKGPAHQLQNGLILLSSIAEELNKSNAIRQGLKMQVKLKILEQQQLLAQVFLSCLTINSQITNYALEAVENWVSIGFPLMKYKGIVNILIMLIEQQQNLFFQNCCRIISEFLKIASQLKFQTLATIDLSQQVQKYTPDQIESLKLIIIYVRSTKAQIFSAIKTIQGIQNIQFYTSIVKEMLLSFGFLLLEDVGFQLIEIMLSVLQSKSLKLSFSTFQFWLDFCQKWSKHNVQINLQNKIWSIIQYLLSVILLKVKLESSSLNELKQQDTIDDLQDVSFTEYRKESRYIIKATYEYFTKKKQKQGSNTFFKKLITKLQQLDATGLGIGTELAIFAVKSSIQSMIQEYDTFNLISFIEYLISKTENVQNIPIKLIAEFLGIITDCNREIKSKDGLFLKCLVFSLKYAQDQQLCHYSVYAFQSLMQSIQNICSVSLINDLLVFYQSRKFTKQIVLQKILDGILTSITKLQDRNVVIEYFTRILNAIIIRNNQILNCTFQPQTHFLPLIQIKTVLDCFDNFKPEDKDYFRTIFLGISNQGIAIVTRIIRNYLANGLKFSNVNELGVSLAVCKNSLKICENIGVEYLPINSYIELMNIILTIFNPNDMSYYSTYSSLIEIINRILTQFMNIKVPQINNWLAQNLLPINNFYLSYSQQKTKFTQNDSDIIKDLFIIQESVLVYSQEIFLSQPQTEQIFNLALLSLQYLNQKQIQRKVVYFIYLCVQIPAFKCKFNVIVRSVFYSIPFVNNICYINIGRILILTLEGVDSKKKEQAFRELFQYQPFTDVQRDLKEIFAKFLAFAVQSKVQRYIKGVLNDITDAKWKKSGGNDLALHLQMRFMTWKREYNKSIKSGQVPK